VRPRLLFFVAASFTEFRLPVRFVLRTRACIESQAARALRSPHKSVHRVWSSLQLPSVLASETFLLVLCVRLLVLPKDFQS
jgi:hypothetical protein